MKKILALVLALSMIFALCACGSTATSASSTSTESTAAPAAEATTTEAAPAEAAPAAGGAKKVVLALADASDYYIGTMVGGAIQEAAVAAGADVQILDAGSDVQNQISQIQNAIISGAEIIYIFPTGDGEVYRDVLEEATAAGVKTIMNGNYPGDGYATTFVDGDEYRVGAMMAAMVSKWADETFPDAGAGEVPVLIVESAFNQNMIKRDLGMRLVGEKFLRYADMASIYYVKEDGDAVTYIDADGNEVAVDEPTGGLILDADGHAQLNPYYNEKIKIVEYSDRNTAGTDSSVAQNAIENSITMGQQIYAVMSYGDTGAAITAKMTELVEDGRIDADLTQIATFCSDLTDVNKANILDDTCVFYGVMTNGNAIQTLCDRITAMINGEEVETYSQEPQSYVCNDGNGGLNEVFYSDCPQLPETSVVFG